MMRVASLNTSIRVHDLRHTAATLLLQRVGLDLFEVSRMLGRSDIAITMKHIRSLGRISGA